jgi:hypothetical protein
VSAFVIKAYTNKELYNAYGVSKHVFKTWMDRIREKVGEPVGGFYTPAQVRIIIDHFDAPETTLNNNG